MLVNYAPISVYLLGRYRDNPSVLETLHTLGVPSQFKTQDDILELSYYYTLTDQSFQYYGRWAWSSEIFEVCVSSSDSYDRTDFVPHKEWLERAVGHSQKGKWISPSLEHYTPIYKG